MKKKLILIVSFVLTITATSLTTFAVANKTPRNKEVPGFERWKKSFVKRYRGKGVPSSFLRKNLLKISFNPAIIEKDRNQVTRDPDINYKVWIKDWLNDRPKRIMEGKKILRKYKKLLSKIETKYRVDREVIVSLWGVESKYGQYTGRYDVITSLASLSFDKRRRNFFEKQLFSALRILYQGHIPRKKMLGSWAGAIGQCQFMPSSFFKYAQDFDGDGKKDIWNNPADIMASIANYLKGANWKKGKSIGKLTRKKSLKRTANRKIASIPLKNSPMILRGANFMPIMRWNKSELFAALNIILMEALSRAP